MVQRFGQPDVPYTGEKKNKIPMLYLDWKADGTFSYYDKETATSKKFSLDEIAVISIQYMVKGFSTKMNCKVYSNRIDELSEEVEVRLSRDGSMLMRGTRGEIQEKCEAEGWNMFVCIVGLVDGHLVDMSFKKSAYYAWNDARSGKPVGLDKKKPLGDEVETEKFDINVNKAKLKTVIHRSKGTIKWALPVFTKGSELTEDDKENMTLIAHKLFNA